MLCSCKYFTRKSSVSYIITMVAGWTPLSASNALLNAGLKRPCFPRGIGNIRFRRHHNHRMARDRILRNQLRPWVGQWILEPGIHFFSQEGNQHLDLTGAGNTLSGASNRPPVR